MHKHVVESNRFDNSTSIYDILYNAHKIGVKQ